MLLWGNSHSCQTEDELGPLSNHSSPWTLRLEPPLWAHVLLLSGCVSITVLPQPMAPEGTGNGG